MPVDAVGTAAGATSLIDSYSIGANADKKKEAETLATTRKMTEAEKESLFLKKMNEGQRTDKVQTTKEDPSKLGKDDFMKLLLATLKYQDPTQPMDTAQLLEQTSTMTNMEQMIQMTEASKQAFEAQQKVQGTTMVGKTVVYDAIDKEGNAITTAGKVDAVEFLAEGKILAHIGNQKVNMEDILGVADPTEDPALTAAVNKAVDESKAAEGAAKDSAAAGAGAAARAAAGQTADPVADDPTATTETVEGTETPAPTTTTNTQA
ncbi:MAG: flagellar hook capping protein [Mobiluncus sp.]|uniref:flagellar hook assembly protein FlgD n=1 Tax=Mobiluncus sp. TaxID=47293 RepID=UPI0025874E14|nr:flagellar hook capping FlgD N-terminal domain-containing protein [Mobiluncus sp.]MCI6584706.1 flagellar hook capping protein [Mobiluncus sp.]